MHGYLAGYLQQSIVAFYICLISRCVFEIMFGTNLRSEMEIDVFQRNFCFLCWIMLDFEVCFDRYQKLFTLTRWDLKRKESFTSKSSSFWNCGSSFRSKTVMFSMHFLALCQHNRYNEFNNLFYCGICSFRFASGINNSFDYIVAGVFTWTVLTICSSLLVMQAELVEYKHLNALFI